MRCSPGRGSDSFGRVRIVVSEDGGATWSGRAFYAARAHFEASLWRSIRAPDHHDVAPAATPRAALIVDRGASAAPSGVVDSTCRLRVRLENSDGFTLP